MLFALPSFILKARIVHQKQSTFDIDPTTLFCCHFKYHLYNHNKSQRR